MGLTVTFVLAHILSLTAFGAFAGLLPTFFELWGLSSSEAGWINGLYLAGYMVAVPFLVAVTDRIDARLIYLGSNALVAAALLAFALLAEGFWSALLWRMLAGVGLAGTYMPGLKALTDRMEGGGTARAVAFYTASFSIGTALSFLAVGELEPRLGWRWATALLALGPIASGALIALASRPRTPEGAGQKQGALLDFRPVVRNRRAFAYILAYAAHSWELFAFRSWLVAYLVFAQSLQPGGMLGREWNVTAFVAVVIMLGLPASVLGNEASQRWGRRPVVIAIMITSALLACAVGFFPGLPFPLLAAVIIIYGCTVTGESASLTAGAIANTPNAMRGATLAVHSFIGFAGASAGPIVFGWMLEVGGGQDTPVAWGLAFASAGVAVGIGGIVVWRAGHPRARG
jgi:MFS family permease